MGETKTNKFMYINTHTYKNNTHKHIKKRKHIMSYSTNRWLVYRLNRLSMLHRSKYSECNQSKSNVMTVY